MQIAVMGAGSWGSALAMQLARAGNHVRLWDHRSDRAETMQRDRENARYLPGLRFQDTVTITGNLEFALHNASLVVVAIPSQSIRAAMRGALPLLPQGVVLCCASKGIEQGSLMTMEEVFHDVIPDALEAHMCFLAGPSFAKEVAHDLSRTGLGDAVRTLGWSE